MKADKFSVNIRKNKKNATGMFSKPEIFVLNVVSYICCNTKNNLISFFCRDERRNDDEMKISKYVSIDEMPF